MAETATPRELLEDVRSLLESGEYTKLVALIASQHAADINELTLELESEERQELLSHFPPEVIGQMYEFAEASELGELVRATPLSLLPHVLATVDDDVVADALQELDEEDRETTLRALDAEKDIQGLLEYEEQSAGGIMSRGFVALEESMTVQQAIDYLRAAQPSSTQTYYLYVVDSEQHLMGNLNIRDLLVSAPYTRLGDITNRDIHEVTTETDQEEAARTLQRYNLLAVPVVDDGGRLVGVTLAEDLIDVVREEATEDMYRMVGLDEQETASTGYLRTIRLRLPWLIVNVFTAAIGGLVVTQFESTLERAVVLAAFMPIVANQSGVTGMQTATIVVRTMAIRGSASGVGRQALRELAVGLTNGFAVGLILGTLGALLFDNLTLGLVLLVTMTLASAIATLVGQLVPVVLRLAGADPALASSIFVTMTTDALAFLILLSTGGLVIDQLS